MDSSRSRPSASAYSASTRARASPMGGSSARRPVKAPSASPSWAQTMVVEQRTERLDHQIEGSGDEHGPVTEGPVLADPGEPGGERLGQEEVVEDLPSVVPEQVGRAPPRSDGRRTAGSRPGPPVERRGGMVPQPPDPPRRRPARPAPGVGMPARRRTPPRWMRSACSRGRMRPGGGRARGWTSAPGPTGWLWSICREWYARGRARPPTAGGRRGRTLPVDGAGVEAEGPRSSSSIRSHSANRRSTRKCASVSV